MHVKYPYDFLEIFAMFYMHNDVLGKFKSKYKNIIVLPVTKNKVVMTDGTSTTGEYCRVFSNLF